MNSLERVRKAVKFDGPDRVPFSGIDTIGVGFNNVDEDLLDAMKNGRTVWTDEWGIEYHRPTESHDGVDNKGIPKTTPLASYKNIEDYPLWPDANDLKKYGARYHAIEEGADRAEKEGKYLCVSWFGLSERAWMLEGMEQFFINLVMDPDRVHRVLDQVARFTLTFLDHIAGLKGRVHGLYTGDDWGTQKACYISMGHFREFFKPVYKQIIAKAHALNMHVWMHSCGNVTELIQEMIEAGLDVINLQQPLALGIDNISRRYRGKIAFEVPADIQKMLPVNANTSRDEIEKHVEELIAKWGTSQGGIIGMDYGGYKSIGTTPERAGWAMEAFKRHVYKKI